MWESPQVSSREVRWDRLIHDDDLIRKDRKQVRTVALQMVGMEASAALSCARVHR